MLSKILLKCAEVAFTRHRTLFKSSRTLSQFLECQLQFSELLQSPESAPFKPHVLLSLRQKEAMTVLPQEDVRAHLSVAVLRRACTGLLKVLSCRTFMGSLGVWPWYKISIFFRIVWDSFFLAKLIFEDLFLKETISASCGTGSCHVSFLYEKSSSCYSHYPPFHTRPLTSVHQWLPRMRTCLCG